MSEYVRKIAIGAIVAVAVAVGLGFELGQFVPGNGGVSSSTTASTVLSSQSITSIPANGSTSTSATMSTANSISFQYSSVESCGPVGGEGGPIFLRVISDQGSIIANGSFEATYWPFAKCGATEIRSLPLTPNATGYTQIANDSAGTGSFNLTLKIGYGGDKTYTTTISFLQGPETFYYVTVAVPSGDATIVSCYGASCSTKTVTAIHDG